MTQHFKFPFRWDSRGRARTVAQGSYEEVEQGVRVLFLTHRGERLEVPEFGIEEVTFSSEIDTDRLQATALEWDERAEVVLNDTIDGEPMIHNLLVQVTERED